MKILRVGDPHVKINNLAESEKLMQFALSQAVERNVDRIEILGDLFHTHAIVRVEVLEFWLKWLQLLSEQKVTLVLVGNHDQTGNHVNKQHALSAFKQMNLSQLYIIDEPKQFGDFAYVPYIHQEHDFASAANGLAASGAKVLVCHQTFEGSKYDNGMYAPDGFDIEKISFDLIISGHIHARQRYGPAEKQVIYPGTAKWDTNSDANEEKGLWLVTHGENGKIVSEEFLDTSSVCTPIFSISWKEGDVEPVIPAGRVTLELVGSSDWIKTQKTKLKGKCGLSSKITDKNRPERRKVGKGLLDFLGTNFDPIAGVTRQQVIDYMKELELV